MLSKKKKVSIFTYTNKNIGYGHYKRSKILYEYLKNYFNCSFYTNQNITKKKIAKSDVIIFDHHYKRINNELIKDKFVIGLDYYGKSNFNRNILVLKQKKIYTKYNNINIENIIIDKKKLNYKKKNIKKNSVLISLGSSNKKKLISKIISNLIDPKFKITIIKGLYNSEKLKKYKNVKIFNFRDDFYDLLRNHEFIITNTATTLFEAIYLKKKIISIPQTKFEENLYHKIFQNKFNLKNLNLEIKPYNFKIFKKYKFNGEIRIKKYIYEL